jgi:hypothetical protein
MQLLVWDGHSCPSLLTLVVQPIFRSRSVHIEVEVKATDKSVRPTLNGCHGS